MKIDAPRSLLEKEYKTLDKLDDPRASPSRTASHLSRGPLNCPTPAKPGPPSRVGKNSRRARLGRYPLLDADVKPTGVADFPSLAPPRAAAALRVHCLCLETASY